LTCDLQRSQNKQYAKNKTYMKLKLSLKQTWTFIVLLSVVVPAVIVMIWYGTTMYTNELNNALTQEHERNKLLQFHIESEVNRLKTLLKNKTDPLNFLVKQPLSDEAIIRINSLLKLIVAREPAIQAAILFTTDNDIISVYNPAAKLITDKALSSKQKKHIASHWGFADSGDYPELVIPSLGRNYIGPVIHLENQRILKISVPVSNPVKAILAIEVNAEDFIRLSEIGVSSYNTQSNTHYILDRRGTLVTKNKDGKYKPGDLMTHLEIVRTALIGANWSSDKSYTGIIDEPVYGTLTTISPLGWTLISEVSTHKIIQPIKDSLIKMLSLTMLGLIIFIWLALYLAKKTLFPIQQASDAIVQVAKGNYQVTLQNTGIKELDAMVSSIDYMAIARQKAEKALLESEQDLIITLNSIGDAVIACDAEGRVSRMNPVAQQLTGWSIDQAKGLPIETIFKIVNATTRETISNPVDKVLTTGETVYLSNHTTLISKDGNEYQIADSAAPLRDDDGTILGMVLAFNDVTEQYRLREQANLTQLKLQAKEKEQSDMLNSMVNSVISIDEDGIVLSFNKAAEKLFGYREEEIKGKNIKLLMPDAISIKHNGYLKRYINSHKTDIIDLSRDVEGKHKNNKIFPMRLSISELPRDQKGKHRFIGSCIDLTLIKQQEEQLRRTQKMDALGKLTGGIAHDYNNMLGVVTGYAELLENALVSQPKLSRYANRIIHAGERGSNLTNKLLSFSKQGSSKARNVDVNIILNDMRHMLEKTLTVRINLILKLTDKIWPVWISSADFEDVILNMTINAMHAIESNGKLTIQSENETLDLLDSNILGLPIAGDYIKLSITDTGCGMDDETREKIFDPFYTTKGDKGTGLGLSQAYGFVERNNGTIKVYSELDKGTKFVLYIPRYYEKDSNKPTIEKYQKASAKGHEKILVVDDEIDLLSLNCEILKSHSYTVFSAENAKQALKILESQDINLVLSDVLMPEMDGFQLSAIVKEKYPEVKIQLVSGFTDNRHSDEDDSELQKNLLSKPLNSQKLLLRIRSLLDEI